MGQATDDYIVHAHWMLDNKGYRHTLRIHVCNTFCFSTATVIAQMHLRVTLHVHCLACYMFKWSIWLVSEHIIIPFYQVPEHGTCCIGSIHRDITWELTSSGTQYKEFYLLFVIGILLVFFQNNLYSSYQVYHKFKKTLYFIFYRLEKENSSILQIIQKPRELSSDHA